MADKKLLPGIVPVDKVRRHPWYKERLHTKYQKEKSKKQHLSSILDTSRWRFLKPGLDDFRDGYPPSAVERTFAGAREGSGGGGVRRRRTRLTKEQACFSKQNPRQQAQRERVREVEYSLTLHPLALYPHLQECMSPELFDQVVSVLDPELSLNRDAVWPQKGTDEEGADEEGADEEGADEEGADEEGADDCAEQCELSLQDLSQPKMGRSRIPSPNVTTDDSGPKNPYLRLLTKENKEDQASNVKRMQSPSLEDEIKRVTKKLHDWVVSLGGESDDLSESALSNLFVSVFERRPSLTLPIRLVDPQSIPEELHGSLEDLHSLTTPDTFLRTSATPKRHSFKVKMNYGDCSLEPETLKKINTDEPVQDLATVSKDQGLSTTASKQDEELKQSYTAQAFKKFILSKGLREPGVLRPLFSDEERENRKNRSESDCVGSAFTGRLTLSTAKKKSAFTGRLTSSTVKK